MFTLTAREFFEKQLPALLKSAPPPVSGIVEFTIEGDTGGVWWVDFGARTVTKAGANAPKLTVLVRAAERDFVALVEGRMSAADGLLTQRLHLAGDPVAITQLTQALTAYGTAGARTARP